MGYFLYFYVFFLGAIVGSFLNVVILRYNTGKSIVKGGSKCFSCGKKLKWHELVPIFSFLLQKGKCRACGSKISWQYPLVEIATGLLFLLIFNFQFSIFNQFSIYLISNVLFFWIITALLIIITVYDLRHMIIPNKLVWIFNGLAFFFVLFGAFDLSFFSNFEFRISNFWPSLVAGLIFAAFFALLWLVSKGTWMGLGDAKLALGIGLLSGPIGTVSVFLFSFWIGALVGIFLLFYKRLNLTIKSRIPFAPFLVLGFLIYFLFDFDVVDLLTIFDVFI